MRMMLTVVMPHEPFNTMVRKGTVAPTLQKIMADMKPEAAYFTETNGKRTGVFVLDIPEPSRIPGLCEPFFLNFNADCKLRLCMTPEDLAKSGIDKMTE